MNKLLTALFALALSLTLARSVYAADAGVEFGVADDLTVLGTEGLSTLDPDVEIKGFTVFGSTQNTTLNIPLLPGNIWVNGAIQVSSGAYFATSSTFTGTVNLPAITNVKADAGTADQVIKRHADGGLYWAADNDGGASTISGTPLRLLMIAKTGSGAVPSLFLQNDDASPSNITMLAGSSMTILGDGTDGLGVTGATKLNGALSVLGGNATTLTGALSVTGVTTLNGATYLGAAATRSTVTAAGNIYMASGSSITLTGSGAQIFLPNAPVIGNDAANKAYVDTMVNSAGPWTRDNAHDVRLTNAGDSVGVGITVPRARLHIASAAVASEQLFAVSTGTTNSSQDVFALIADGNNGAKAGLTGNLAIGSTYANNPSAPTDGMAVEGAVGIGTNVITSATGSSKLEVKGVDAPGQYVATFYSGTKIAAWVRQK